MKNLKRFFPLSLCLAFAMALASTSFAQVVPPQGRLSLQSNTAVMTGDVYDTTTIYYVPYAGNNLVVSNGTSLSNQTFTTSMTTQLTLTVSSFGIANQLYDVYAYYVSGAFQLCATDWGSTATTSRPTSPQNYSLTTLQGVWVNAGALTSACEGNTTTYSVPAKEGIYLGSFYSSPATGLEPEMGVTVLIHPAAASGGPANGGGLIGLWNAYNRVRVTARELDSNSSWTYASTSFRAADSSTNNSITFLDGLGLAYISARYQSSIAPSSQGGAVGVALDWNGSSSPADIVGGHNSVTTSQFNSEKGGMSAYPGSIGLHNVQALEAANNTNTLTFYGVESGWQVAGLFLDTEF